MIAFTRLNDGIDSRQTTLLNTIATFKCNDGFELVGEPTRTCELSGWSGSNPTCGMLYDPISCNILCISV